MDQAARSSSGENHRAREILLPLSFDLLSMPPAASFSPTCALSLVLEFCIRAGLTCSSNPRDATSDRTISEVNDDDSRVLAIAVSPKDASFCTGSEDGVVRRYTLQADGNPAFESYVCRFEIGARCLAYSPDGELVACGSDQGLIKVVRAISGEETATLTTDGPVPVSLAYDPEGEFLAVLHGDGSLAVWEMSKARVCFAKKRAAPRSSLHGAGGSAATQDPDAAVTQGSGPHVCRLCWARDGLFLFVPSADEVTMFPRLEWRPEESADVLHDKAVKGPIYVAALSPNGAYLAVADRHRTLAIFSVSERRVVSSTTTGAVVTALAWSQQQGSRVLAALDGEGRLGRWEGCLPEDLPGPNDPVAEEEAGAAAAEDGQGQDQAGDNEGGSLCLSCVSLPGGSTGFRSPATSSC